MPIQRRRSAVVLIPLGGAATSRSRSTTARIALVLAWAIAVAAADDFTPVLANADLDPSAFAEWMDGAETAIGPDRRREGPAWVTWTRDGQAGWYGQEFGDSTKPGPRHLRIGFARTVPVGTILAAAERLSVLKPDAAYPGDLGDDAQWIPAQRVGREALIATADGGECATWILPPGTTTRALRVTHVAQQNDRRYNGWIGAVRLMAGRYDNIAIQATVTASANSEAATKVIDGRDNGAFDGWDNGDQGQELPISPEDPAWVMLSWKEPRTIAGVCLVNAGAGAAEVQYCTASADRHPTLADDEDWTTAVAATPVDPLYPRALPLCPLPFAKAVTTRGVRVRFVTPFDDANCHGHIAGKAAHGRRMWLSEVMALTPLGDAPVTAPVAARRDDDHPPIPIRFHLAKPGLVTLVIEDADGNRVRNLVSETRFPAGDNTAWWDGLDDRDRDYEAAAHHTYRIPGKLVAPATYRVRGLVRDDLSLTYEFSFYTHGTPAWDTADGSGGWLANHTPPQSCAFVPGAMTSDGKDIMLLGSPITEGGSGLAWVDLDGRKRNGRGWIGGNWTGAAHLAVDRGAKRVSTFYAYAAAAAEGELRLTGLKHDGDAPVLKWRFPDPTTCDCAGVAVHDGLLATTLPKLGTVMFVDVASGRLLGQVPCADPRGVAFDAQGRLWVLSGTRLMRATLPNDLAAHFGGVELDRASWSVEASTGDATLAIDGKDDTRWDTTRPQQPDDWFQIDLGKRQRIGRISLEARRSAGDFPRLLDIQVSDDGADWGKSMVSLTGVAGDNDVTLPPTTTRYIRLVSTGSDPGAWWSTHEIRVFAPATGLTDLAAKPVVAKLEDPIGICIDGDLVYVSDRGASHQVKVFGADGAPKRVIGKPGKPAVGPYDRQHLNTPAGMAVDSRGRLWVAEYDNQPKRISVWKADGSLDQEYFGPARYGCGGTIDPADKSRLFFEGMEFALDWKKGTDRVKDIIWRGGLDVGGQPERMEHVGGYDYLTSTYTSNPTGAAGVVGIWALAKGVATPIASAGRAQWWPPLADRFAKLGAWSVRWTGTVVPTVDGETTFHTVSDDGVRLWVDGKPLIDNWTGHGPVEDAGTIALKAGKPVAIRLEWFQGAGGATIRLLWSAAGLAKAVIPTAQLIPEGAKAPGGLRGEYHNGNNLDQPKFTRTDATIDVEYGNGAVIEIPGSEAASAAFRARLPEGAVFERDALLYAWSDRDHDGAVDADEVTFQRDEVGGVTVQPDLSLATSTGLVVMPSGFDATGLPLYDAASGTAVVPGGRVPNTSGGGNTLVCADGWTVLTIPPEPFPQQSSMSGAKDGAVKWTYPSLWPGLHPSHSSPVADRPGMLIGTTRVIGPAFQPTGSDAGWCWAINGNHGCVYVFTSDGLFVATLFRDSRQASGWAMPTAQRGMHLEETTLQQENFWPSLTQCADGGIYLVSGSSIVAVGGLDTITRIPASDLAVSADQLAAAATLTLDREAERQREQGSGTLKVALLAEAPTVDGALDEWTATDWATIDRRTVTVGDWGSRLDQVTGAVAISGDRLYAAFRNADGNLLRNAGTTWQTLFKSGGCLDLMIGADPSADSDRREPVAGDCRLLVSRVEGQLVAVLYRPHVPGHAGERFTFTSPVSSVAMDGVERVDDQIRLADKDGDYELSVPLALLGLEPANDQAIKADIGILRGNGFQTMQRCYWANKATSMTADVPSEARLTPMLWGRWTFVDR